MGSPFVKDMFAGIVDPDQPLYGHACEMETSQVMYLAPWAAREDRKKGEIQDSAYSRRIFKDGGCPVNWRTDASANGALGDARKATAELGKKMTEHILDEVENLILQLTEKNAEKGSKQNS
jgi:creatinine amidohydrolase